ncbi:MAG: hypothetical protein E5X41_14845 [Mesorhizobium sp.]|nr:MAG: hypothetical protein E5X41_14845 [Mesorhizobium sp.]
MRFVVKDADTGHYITGLNRWSRKRVDSVNKARIYHHKAPATQCAKEMSSRAYRYIVVGVTLTEVPV